MDDNSKQEKKQKKYRILTYNEKQEIIGQLSKKPSIEVLNDLSDIYQTSVKNIRRWFNDGIKRKKGCGRKKLNPSAEDKLQLWCLEQSIKQGKRVRRSQLKSKAIELFNDENFKASKAWQDEFIRNFDIKFKINAALNERGLLNQLQKIKFQEMKEARDRNQNGEGTNNDDDSSETNSGKREDEREYERSESEHSVKSQKSSRSQKSQKSQQSYKSQKSQHQLQILRSQRSIHSQNSDDSEQSKNSEVSQQSQNSILSKDSSDKIKLPEIKLEQLDLVKFEDPYPIGISNSINDNFYELIDPKTETQQQDSKIFSPVQFNMYRKKPVESDSELEQLPILDQIDNLDMNPVYISEPESIEDKIEELNQEKYYQLKQIIKLEDIEPERQQQVVEETKNKKKHQRDQQKYQRKSRSHKK